MKRWVKFSIQSTQKANIPLGDSNSNGLEKWPAAAVIPAPIAYIKVVAVKKLVVELWVWPICLPHGCTGSVGPFLLGNPMLFIERSGEPGLLP